MSKYIENSWGREKETAAEAISKCPINLQVHILSGLFNVPQKGVAL